MKPAQKIFDVEIAGTPLKLRTSNDESTVRQLIEMVDAQITAALEMSKNKSLQTAALVAALNIAEELFMCKRQAREELTRLGLEAEKLLSDLESTQFSQSEVDH